MAAKESSHREQSKLRSQLRSQHQLSVVVDALRRTRPRHLRCLQCKQNGDLVVQENILQRLRLHRLQQRSKSKGSSAKLLLRRRSRLLAVCVVKLQRQQLTGTSKTMRSKTNHNDEATPHHQRQREKSSSHDAPQSSLHAKLRVDTSAAALRVSSPHLSLLPQQRIHQYPDAWTLQGRASSQLERPKMRCRCDQRRDLVSFHSLMTTMTWSQGSILRSGPLQDEQLKRSVSTSYRVAESRVDGDVNGQHERGRSWRQKAGLSLSISKENKA